MTDGETAGAKVKNKKLNYLHHSPNIIQVIKIYKNDIGRACRTYWKGGGVYMVLVGET